MSSAIFSTLFMFNLQCFFVDNELKADLEFGDYNHYNPKENPLDPSSAPSPAVFEGLTGQLRIV